METVREMEGQCPYCESENVEYKVLEVQDGDAYYPIICNDCGKAAKEWYHLKYSETIGYD